MGHEGVRRVDCNFARGSIDVLVAWGVPLTVVSFHFNVPDRTDYTCRLLRKALRKGARVVVTGAQPVLSNLDRALWSFDPLEFVPHVMVRPGQEPALRLRTTPVWLVSDLAQAEHHDVLVNLQDDAPAGFERFARLIEIVTPDEGDRVAARQRWKHYATRGHAIEKHEVVG
jgi:DNA polymerase-3 subunit chi